MFNRWKCLVLFLLILMYLSYYTKSNQYYKNMVWWFSIFVAVNYNPLRRDLNLHDVYNLFLKAIIEFFQAKIVLQERSLDIHFWELYYILICIEHKRSNRCLFISNRIWFDISNVKISNSQNIYLSTCNYLLALSYEALYSLQATPTPTINHG